MLGFTEYFCFSSSLAFCSLARKLVWTGWHLGFLSVFGLCPGNCYLVVIIALILFHRDLLFLVFSDQQHPTSCHGRRYCGADVLVRAAHRNETRTTWAHLPRDSYVGFWLFDTKPKVRITRPNASRLIPTPRQQTSTLTAPEKNNTTLQTTNQHWNIRHHSSTATILNLRTPSTDAAMKTQHSRGPRPGGMRAAIK